MMREILRALTKDAAERMRLGGEIWIASGKRADFVAVEGNPIEDAEALRGCGS
jgi:imidazolonepropionase-like amidohydrolase